MDHNNKPVTTATPSIHDKSHQHTDDQTESSQNSSKISGWLHWHEPGTSAEEKRLIFKLDWFLLSYSCLMFFIKQIDGNNVTNAYASGMSEELGFGPGNELSWMNTYFNIGTIIGSSFSNLAITIIRPSYWLPGCMLIWSTLVLGLHRCNTATQIYILRFFIGLFESAAWPGIMYCLGTWYRKSELGRRSGLFVMSGVLGQMFSGYLQSALYAGMEGRGGMAAWRWLFVFDFVIAVPVVIYGFAFFPDTPDTTRRFYLSVQELTRARKRIAEEGRLPVGKWDRTVFFRIFGSWQVYIFTLGYAMWTLTAGSYVMQYFTLYLKATGLYSVEQYNSIPTAIAAVNWFTIVVSGFVVDKIGRRGPVCLAIGCVLIFVYAVLAVWNGTHAFRMAVFILSGVYGCYTPILAGWVNESCGGDQQKRAFVLAFMVSVGQAVVIPLQQLQFPSSEAPSFERTNGWASALAFVVALTVWTGVGIPVVQRWRQGKIQETGGGRSM